jgi:pimeloyl-ACP methyl ester carboxylesterase
MTCAIANGLPSRMALAIANCREGEFMAASPGKSKEKTEEPSTTKWHESLFGIDLLMLHASPVYYGVGVPHGNGSAVIMIPGFMHSDVYLVIMYAWLERLGYRPYYSGIDLNAECPNLLIKNQLNRIVDEAQNDTGQRVHLVGHSLGGIIARSLATQRPESVASVITLGSPFPGVVLRRRILRETEVVRQVIQSRHGDTEPPECYTERCQCDFMKSLHRRVPGRVSETAIFTRSDGVLDWRACRTGNSDIDVEVGGTHAGLAFNPRAYTAIARRLAKQD